MNYLSLENLNLFKNRVKKILGLQDDEIRTIVNKQTTEVSDDSKKAIEEDLTKKLLAASTTGQIQILHPDEQLATSFNTTYTDYAITSTLKVSETKLYDEFVTLTSDDKSVHRIVFQCPLNSVTFKYWKQSESSEQSLKFTNITENEVFTITPPSSTYPKWIISRGYTLYDDSSIQNNMQTLEYEIESEADTGVADVVNLVLKPYTGNYYLQTTKPDVVVEKSTYEDGKTVVSNTDSGMFHFIGTIEEPVFSKQFRIVFKVGLKKMDIQWFNSWKLIQNISAGDILLITTPGSETSNDWSITLLNPQLRSNDGSITIKELNNGGFDISVDTSKDVLCVDISKLSTTDMGDGTLKLSTFNCKSQYKTILFYNLKTYKSLLIDNLTVDGKELSELSSTYRFDFKIQYELSTVQTMRFTQLGNTSFHVVSTLIGKLYYGEANMETIYYY